MFVYIHVQTIYIPCTYMAYRISLCHEQKIQKRHSMQSSGFEPTIMCIAASCLNHLYTTSMLARQTIVAVYVYCFGTSGWLGLGRLVTRRRTSWAADPAPLAAMTSQARASTWISLKPRSAAKQAFKLSETAARARRQVDLEVREFRSSVPDWRARARISHKTRFDAIAKHNKTI